MFASSFYGSSTAEFIPARFGSAPLVLGALAIWLLATLGLRPLLLPDEGRYATVALEMLHGNGLVPTLNGLPFFHKPPLFYWVDMVAMGLLGVGEATARFGSMVGAWIMGACLFFSVRRTHNQQTALVAVAVIATSPFYFVGAQYANHDMLVAGLITVAILALAQAAEKPPNVQLGWLVAGAVACALATLAKGLIGFVLPVLVIAPWLLVQGRWRQVLRMMHPLALLAFILVAAPWFIAMQMRYPGFFDYFVTEQHFRRFAQSSFNNVQPFWFFIPVIPALILPWALWIPSALRRAWIGRNAQVGLHVWWIVAVVGFFSLPSSKLVGYVLPVIAPLCALLATALAQSSKNRVQTMVGLSALICMGIVVAIAWQAPKSSRGAALALVAQIQPGDKVVMVDEYLYDVPFYARLREPVLIASDWTDVNLPLEDNWRKEVFDAARFDPKLGHAVLQPLEKIDSLSCGKAAVWYPVSLSRVNRVATLTGIVRIYADKTAELWRAPARACS